MGIAVPKTPFTPEDFLLWDVTQIIRHEYVEGEVFATAGAEEQHITVSGNVYIALRQHLVGGRCRAYIADMKLHVAARNNYFYPDVMVTCSETDREDTLIKREPNLIVEVLSPSTAAYDRGEKFANYRALPSLREYVLIDAEKRSVDVYRLGDQGLWVLHPADLAVAGASVQFASVDCAMTAEQMFADV
jgi:Uma2 family endonuclease